MTGDLIKSKSTDFHKISIYAMKLQLNGIEKNQSLMTFWIRLTNFLFLVSSRLVMLSCFSLAILSFLLHSIWLAITKEYNIILHILQY